MHSRLVLDIVGCHLWPRRLFPIVARRDSEARGCHRGLRTFIGRLLGRTLHHRARCVSQSATNPPDPRHWAHYVRPVGSGSLGLARAGRAGPAEKRLCIFGLVSIRFDGLVRPCRTVSLLCPARSRSPRPQPWASHFLSTVSSAGRLHHGPIRVSYPATRPPDPSHWACNATALRRNGTLRRQGNHQSRNRKTVRKPRMSITFAWSTCIPPWTMVRAEPVTAAVGIAGASKLPDQRFHVLRSGEFTALASTIVAPCSGLGFTANMISS